MSRRLLASYLTLAAIVLLALEIPLALSLMGNERRDLTTQIEREAVALGSLTHDALRDGSSNADVERLARDYATRTGGRAVIVAKDGTLIVDSSVPNPDPRSFASRPEIQQALAGTVATGVRHSNDLDQDILFVAVPVASAGAVHGAVRITYPTAEIDARVRRTLWILVAIAVAVLGVVALVGWRFARTTAEPLARLERAAVAAGKGDLGARAPVEGPPEVQSVATRFNTMVARLDELLRSQEGFVADASHQLRTPLAALRLRLENLEAHVDLSGRGNLEGAINELDRLNRLVTGLLVLARSDETGGPGELLDVAGVARERVELWEALADEHHVRVVADCPEPVPAQTGAGRLEQIIDNLIENALAVSPPGGTITVTARARTDGAELHVTDDGPGMSPDERARAFDRFWRAPGSTNEGTGLGLAIVQRLVEADRGEITLESASSGGLDVTIRLPGPTGPVG